MNSTNTPHPALPPLRRCMMLAARAWRAFSAGAAWAAVVVLCLPVLLWRLLVDPNDTEDPWRGPE